MINYAVRLPRRVITSWAQMNGPSLHIPGHNRHKRLRVPLHRVLRGGGRMVLLQVSLQGVLLLAAEGAVGAVEGGRVEDLLVEGEEAGRGAGESAADAAGGRHLLVSRRRVLQVSLGTANTWFINEGNLKSKWSLPWSQL